MNNFLIAKAPIKCNGCGWVANIDVVLKEDMLGPMTLLEPGSLQRIATQLSHAPMPHQVQCCPMCKPHPTGYGFSFDVSTKGRIQKEK